MPKVPHKDFGRRFRRFRNFRIFLLNRYQIWDCVQEIGFGHRIHQNPHKESLIKNPIRILVDKVSKKFGHLGSCAWYMRFGCSDLTHAPRNGKMGILVVKPLKVPHKECRKYPTRILVEDSEISGFSSSAAAHNIMWVLDVAVVDPYKSGLRLSRNRSWHPRPD